MEERTKTEEKRRAEKDVETKQTVRQSVSVLDRLLRKATMVV